VVAGSVDCCGDADKALLELDVTNGNDSAVVEDTVTEVVTDE